MYRLFQGGSLVLSPAKYNRVSSLAWICPVTSKRKGYPFEVQVPEGLAIQGVALVDKVRSLDYRQRRAAPKCLVELGPC